MLHRIHMVAMLSGLNLVLLFTPAPVSGSPRLVQDPPAAAMSMADLEEMLGPIALYPDTLLANVLAASVYPDEVTAAKQYIQGGGTVEGIDQQPWEQPVKSLAKVTEALDFLADNIEWTTAIGEVYITQSQDVMAAVQSLRAKAKTNGALQSSEQMTVVESGTNIVIEPAQPEVIYVPQYQPQVVYAPAPVVVEDDSNELAAGIIGFGAGLMTAAIFDDDDDWDCDWDDGCVGWGHGGYNDVDIDREFNQEINIETGDINVNSGNTVTGGDRNRETNVQGGDKTNVAAKGGDKKTQVGHEGQKWEPNKTKVQERQAQSGGQRASEQFRGASNPSSPSRSKVPTKTSAAKTREPAKPLKANNDKPSITPAKAGDRGGNAGSAGSAGDRTANAGGSARNAPKPATKQPPSRAAPAPKPKPKTPTAAAPKPRPATPSAKPTAKSKSSGMSPSGGSSKASSRGASSRGGGGGGGRGGGGRGR